MCGGLNVVVIVVFNVNFVVIFKNVLKVLVGNGGCIIWVIGVIDMSEGKVYIMIVDMKVWGRVEILEKIMLIGVGSIV